MDQQQKRFLLAMVISAVIIMVWQQFFMPPVPPPEEAGEQTEQVAAEDGAAEKKAQQDGAAEDAGAGAGEDVPAARPTPKEVEVAAHTIETERFRLTLSNDGGRVTGIELLDPAQYQKAGDLLGAFPDDSDHFPFNVTFDNGAIKLPAGVVFEVAEAKKDRVVYRYVDPNGSYQVDKIFAVDPEVPYTLEFDVAIKNLSDKASLADQMVLDITGFKDPEAESSFLDFRPDEVEAICRLDGDTERGLFSAVEEPETFKGEVHWGAINTRYFFWGVLPKENAESCEWRKGEDGYLTTTLTWDDFSVAPGATHVYDQKLYIGPKDLDILKEVGEDLNESVDYGILSVLAQPMRWLLNTFHAYVGNWGLAIILLTLLIKLGTWPFTEKSYANTEKMKEIQPKLDEIRAKYENDQQRLAEETMKLFQENGFNPLGGCFPMLLQMPILYALYVMIINSVELYQAEFVLWYTDLSSRDPYFVLPILMGVMMVIQQRWMMTSTSEQNQQAQVMMKVMPIMFTAFMLFLPSGLVLYYSLNLVLGVLQQWLIRRKFARRREAAAAA